ncbi:MAG: hypothetical protein Q4D20_09430 [Clostridia bacterium]|nr:hypothetical protein [Clostridia bacterium]
MSIIKFANLPERKVTKAIISGYDKRIIDYIRTFKVNILFTGKNNLIDPAISDHVDVNINYLGNGEIIIDGSQKHLTECLKESGFRVIEPYNAVSSSYPNDSALNCAEFGERLIARKKSSDKHIIKKFPEDLIIDVNQGYTKCSTCIVNENAIITDDESINKSCRNVGIDSLLISKGDVLLSGHNYGFIGGASALIKKNKILFFGDITKHRDYQKIVSFLLKHRCDYAYLKDYPLTDIGGMIAIEEE